MAYPCAVVDMALDKEIERFAEHKKRLIMSQSDLNEDEWRGEIRRQLEAELNNRVQQALATPMPIVDRSRGAGRRRHRGGSTDHPVGSDELVLGADLSDHEQDYFETCNWKVERTQREIRKILSDSNAELSKLCYTRQQSRILLEGLRHVNRQKLTNFLGELDQHHDDYKSRCYYEELSQKAAAIHDLGELTCLERHSLNYTFTQQGFREALLSGRLPDGTLLEKVNSTWYKDPKSGLLRTEHGPFWPIDFAPVCPAPGHLRNCVDVVEPLLTGDRSEPVANRSHDESIISSGVRWRGLVIVYDTERTPKDMLPPPSAADGHSPSLMFESRFESGNLRQARRVGEHEYELVLQNDLYTKRHTQWFYFRVQNAGEHVTYTFRIVNLLKADSLYKHGMQPLMYSSRSAASRGVGWVRVGHNISYTRNTNYLQCPLLCRDKTYYVLQWQMEFEDTDNGSTEYFLAHCYPYTYTDLCVDLDALLADKERSKVMCQEVLCRTRAGNSCFLLTITDFENKSSHVDNKLGVVLSARVHPGETNSSWVMKGLLTYLTGPSTSAKLLRECYIFKIIPMLNPDGVIVGNYRCSLSGRDLNRNYRHPNPDTFPTIWHLKQMITEFSQNTQVALYCDLHGHSRRQNLFMYGCGQTVNSTGQMDNVVTAELLKSRIFPWLMRKKAPDKFCFDYCKFTIRRSKESTGRVVMFRQFNIQNSFTMETTFCGTTLCKDKERHLNTNDLQSIGRTFAQVALDFCRIHQDKAFELQVLLDLSRYLTVQLLQQQQQQEQPHEQRRPQPLEQLQQLQQQQDLLTSHRRDTQCPRGTDLTDRSDYKSNGHVTSSTSGQSCADIITRAASQMKTLDDCLQLLRHMELKLIDSDSSSSDSDSEPECTMTSKSRPVRRKKRHKKKPANNKDRSKVGTSEGEAVNAPDTSSLPCGTLPAINSSDTELQVSKKLQFGDVRRPTFVRPFQPFVNKYEGRSNGGIPCFSEERLQHRAAKKSASRQPDDNMFLFHFDERPVSLETSDPPQQDLMADSTPVRYALPAFTTHHSLYRANYMQIRGTPVQRLTDDETFVSRSGYRQRQELRPLFGDLDPIVHLPHPADNVSPVDSRCNSISAQASHHGRYRPSTDPYTR